MNNHRKELYARPENQSKYQRVSIIHITFSDINFNSKTGNNKQNLTTFGKSKTHF